MPTCKKVCSKCGRSKPHSEFYREAGHSDGLRSECKACNEKKCLRWRQANPEKARAVRRAQKRRWRLANPEKYRAMKREQKRRCFFRHPEKKLALALRKDVRRRTKDTFGTLPQIWNPLARLVTGDHLERLYCAQDKRCAYCRRMLRPRRRNLDHVIPIRHGGLHARENVVWSCWKCNTIKANSLDPKWVAMAARFIEGLIGPSLESPIAA